MINKVLLNIEKDRYKFVLQMAKDIKKTPGQTINSLIGYAELLNEQAKEHEAMSLALVDAGILTSYEAELLSWAGIKQKFDDWKDN